MNATKAWAVLHGLMLGACLLSGGAHAVTNDVMCLIVKDSRVKIEMQGRDLSSGVTYSGTVRNVSVPAGRIGINKIASDFGRIVYKYDTEPRLPNKILLPPNFAKVGDTVRGTIKRVNPASGANDLSATTTTTCVAKK